MISNNKNKYAKELTLEEIIEKSAFRKNIDNLCLLQNKINKDSIKPLSLVHTPIQAMNKTSSQFISLQHFGSKRSIQSSGHNMKQRAQHASTARTTQSYKQTIANNILNEQNRPKSFKTIFRDQQRTKQFRKSKQNHAVSLERKISSKKKSKKVNDYLCVKGASGAIVVCPKPFTADATNRNMIPEYQLKKYQTLVQLGSQLQKKQKSLQFKASHETVQNQNYHSFMATKYSSFNNIRRKSVSSKSYSCSKFKNNIILPEELLNKKIGCRGIKTEEKNINKVQNKEQELNLKSKQMKKYELVLDINLEEELKKQNKHLTKPQLFFKDPQDTQLSKLSLEGKISREISPTKLQSQDMNKTSSKGFKGTKIKSNTTYEKIKSRYFIPDFIKPSLDLVMFDKKPTQSYKTEQKQSPIKQNEIKNQQNSNKTFNELSQCITGTKFALKLKPTQVDHTIIQKDEKEQKIQDKQQRENCSTQINTSKSISKKRRKVNKADQQRRVMHQYEGQICAWDQHDIKKSLHQMMREAQQFGF